jgi:tryptophan-rich sensory protein
MTSRYLLTGVAARLVWRERGLRNARIALSLFRMQWGVNALWAGPFFAWRRGALAFGEILILWVLILCTPLAFWCMRAIAGALLIPCLARVSFAAAPDLCHLATQSHAAGLSLCYSND